MVIKGALNKTCCSINLLIITVHNIVEQAAVGFDYQANLAKHGSQVDAAKGFGGKYGVQKERTDKVFGCIHIACFIAVLYGA